MKTMAYSVAHKLALSYKQSLNKFEKIAKSLEIVLTQILDKEGIVYQSIRTRAKDPYSVERKIIEKGYKNPFDEITDLVGGRIVVYYEEDIPAIEKTIREYFQVDNTRSVNKRESLGLREFGYSARHFVVRAKKPKLITAEYEDLKDIWFEIQVCTVLEHAWAEIEHEIMYKSTTKYPDAIKRKFAALAGAIEILDHEFSMLRKEESNLISDYVGELKKKTPRKSLDKAWMIALLEHVFPNQLGWRKAAADGKPFKKGLDDRCCIALKRAGIENTSSFERLLRKKALKNIIKTYAANKGEHPEKISHFAIVVLALILHKPKIIKDEFSDFLEDLAMKKTFESIRKATSRKTSSSRGGSKYMGQKAFYSAVCPA